MGCLRSDYGNGIRAEERIRCFDVSTVDELEKLTNPALCPFRTIKNDEESGTLRGLTAKYDEKFFEDYDLVFLAVREASITRRVELTDASFVEDKTFLGVTGYFPEMVMQADQAFR